VKTKELQFIGKNLVISCHAIAAAMCNNFHINVLQLKIFALLSRGNNARVELNEAVGKVKDKLIDFSAAVDANNEGIFISNEKLPSYRARELIQKLHPQCNANKKKLIIFIILIQHIEKYEK
jgi:hypothetical protein